LLVMGCRDESGSELAPEVTSNANGAAPVAPETSPTPAEAIAPPAADGANGGPSSSAAGSSGNEPSTVPTELAPAPSGSSPGSLTGSAGSPATGSAGSGAGGAPSPPATPAGPLTIFIAGDSTVQTYANTASDRDQAGWGQMLAPHVVGGDITIDNRAIGGRTARRFIDEGRLDEILPALLPGDYLLVQFGTNDGNRTATYELGDQTIPYFLDPATDFKSYLQQYLDGARERGATPVLVTPPPRNSAYCTGGNGTGGHAQAMRELGQAQGVSVVDLNSASVNYLKAICPAPTPEDFFLLRADGTVDGTHFQENGARILADFVASGLRSAEPGLATLIE
jgi:lysophospholipase L1-like esterase